MGENERKYYVTLKHFMRVILQGVQLISVATCLLLNYKPSLQLLKLIVKGHKIIDKSKNNADAKEN